MIVFREQRTKLRTADLVPRCPSTDLRQLLIDFGQLESGVADALSPHHPAVAEMRRVAVNLGRIFSRPSRELDLTVRADVPAEVEVGVPEGYAYYAIFPEMYAQAAENFYREVRPEKSMIIGIRTIGTSLSAAVAGAIAEAGGKIESATVRPSGHPYDRVTNFQCAIDPDAYYLLVDEGPGLSGSSFASVAQALADAGIPDSRIVLFPSWDPDPSTLMSPLARARFPRHRKVVPQFDPELAYPGISNWHDVSAGKWRNLLCPTDPPAVNPHHERRKFLRADPPYILAKFVGFGTRGRQAYERSLALHEAGFSPQPLEFKNGFLFTAFVPGKPVSSTTQGLVLRIADYLNQLPISSAPAVPFDLIAEMIETNLAEAFDIDAAPIRQWRSMIEDAPTYELDGRMLPHEWIETSSGYLKTDAVDHFDDHFFPGPQDIAWDVASAVIEFSLDDSFLEKFNADIRRRMPFYKLAYAAFRLGYCRISEPLVDPQEAARFRQLEARYEAIVKQSPLLHHFV